MSGTPNEERPRTSRQPRSHPTVVHADGNVSYWSVRNQRWCLVFRPESIPAWELEAMPPEEREWISHLVERRRDLPEPELPIGAEITFEDDTPDYDRPASGSGTISANPIRGPLQCFVPILLWREDQGEPIPWLVNERIIKTIDGKPRRRP
jgi:hypothetical protein